MEKTDNKEYSLTAYESLMHTRITRILMICSNYDAFIMEEDGRIESRMASEYAELNISNPPHFVWCNSASKAREILSGDPGFDMVICMFNEQDQDIFPFAGDLRSSGSGIPFVLLMHYSKELRRKITSRKDPGVDFIFSWQGNADLILAIIKLFEDRLNAENDILGVGVQAILLVEDSIRYYSTYLPELYKLILTQSHEFLKETLNEDQQKYRKRSRPKILLANSFDEAWETYRKYEGNILGVISDIGMVIHRGDPPESEKADAGVDLVKKIRQEHPLMPILMQSSQGSMEQVAHQLGAGFVKKYSSTLFMELSDFIREEFGFGDFVFKDRSGKEYGRASSLQELGSIIDSIPDQVLVSNTSRNMFSKWFFARGLFSLAKTFRSEHHIIANEARQFLKEKILAYHKLVSRGIIAEFSEVSYDQYIPFARMGEGSLGGKARGLAFLNSLISKHSLSDAYKDTEITIPRTVVISSDYFDTFIQENGLQYVIDSELSDDEILSEFVASRLPEGLVRELKAYLETVDKPLAVRSSSKLEDSDYQPFAGVYSTYMIPWAENRDQMFRMLGNAIKSVYASAFYNGSRTYIHTTGNLQAEEKMSVVVQDICGSFHDSKFFPLISGVARSINFYPIGNEKPEDGIANVVMGLGKMVVDGGKSLRFSPEYPANVLQLSRPDLAMTDAQDMMYALDMRPGSFKISRNEGMNFVSLSVNDVARNYPFGYLALSTYDIGMDMIVPGKDAEGPKLVTYDGILKYGRYPLAKALKDILSICRKELAAEVEIEFAADVDKSGRLSLNLLQVRPINLHSKTDDITVEEAREKIGIPLIESTSALGNGLIQDMDHIIYVGATDFDSLQTREIALEIARFNKKMREEGNGYLLIGPGRWGSAVPSLGVPVRWSDISEAKMIVECAIDGFQIEPSQGTHFFQNITSLGVGYLSINTVINPDSLNTGALDGMECIEKGKYARLLRCATPLVAFIDRDSNHAVVGLSR